MFAEMAAGAIAADALALPPALGGSSAACCWRNLSCNWARAPEVRGAQGMPLVAQTPAAASALADDLARLIDDMTMRRVSWDRLDGLVPEDARSISGRLTLKFLQIARQQLAANPARARPHRTGRAPRRLDQSGSRAACAQDRRAGDRCRFDRLDSGDRRTDRHHRAPAARRRRAAGARHGSRRGVLAADRWQRARRCLAGARPSAIRAAGAARAHRHRPRRGGEARRPRSGRERLVSEVLRPAAATELWRQRAVR